MKLIIGLGNPGPEYTNTRHNAGFLAVNAFVKESDGVWKMDDKRHAEISKIDDVVLAKPTTFMNSSGDAVQALASFYKVEIADILIVHDEMDLAPGRIQFKLGGGDAGHNGIASIVERMGTDAFPRLRLGVGRPQDRQPAADYVLGPLSPQEDLKLVDIVAGMRDWIEGGLDRAMNTWNRT